MFMLIMSLALYFFYFLHCHCFKPLRLQQSYFLKSSNLFACIYTSELARHQNRIIFLEYNLDLCRVFGVVDTPAHNYAKPSNNAYSIVVSSSNSNGAKIQNDFAKFSKRNDIVIANRLEDELKKVSDKVYARVSFARD